MKICRRIVLFSQIGCMIMLCSGIVCAQTRSGSVVSVLKVDLQPNPHLDSLFAKESPQILIYKKSNSGNEVPRKYAHRELPPGERTATFLFAKDNDSIVVMVVSSIQIQTGLSFAKSIVKEYHADAVLKAGDTVTVGGVFPQPCKYDLTIYDKTCPACNQTDSVRILLVGCPVYDPEESDSSFSDVGYWDLSIESTGCNPNWYCLRDKIAF